MNSVSLAFSRPSRLFLACPGLPWVVRFGFCCSSSDFPVSSFCPLLPLFLCASKVLDLCVVYQESFLLLPPFLCDLCGRVLTLIFSVSPRLRGEIWVCFVATF